MQFKSRGTLSLWIGRQRRGNQFETIVEPRRNTVHRSNESAGSSADHTQPETPVCWSVAFGFAVMSRVSFNPVLTSVGSRVDPRPNCEVINVLLAA